VLSEAAIERNVAGIGRVLGAILERGRDAAGGSVPRVKVGLWAQQRLETGKMCACL
jgi:hypothetical protein